MTSLYYQLARDEPLGLEERLRMQDVVDHYDVGRYATDGETFSFYSWSQLPVVLDGSVKLPSGDPKVTLEALYYWCELLSSIRHVVHGGAWDVRLDELEVGWDEEAQAYGPQ